MSPSKLVAFDVETTGLDPNEDEIIELAIITLNGDLDKIDETCQRYKPYTDIHPDAADVHGITNEDLENKPPFHHHAPKIQELIEEVDGLIAYNAKFDCEFLDQQLKDAGHDGIPVDTPIIDPYLIFREQFPRTLEAAVRYYTGDELENAHEALADTRAAVDVLDEQLDHNGWPDNLDDADDPPGRTYLDWACKFYRDEDGVARFNFGKNKGEATRNHPQYLLWMRSSVTDFSENTKQWASRLLDEWREQR